MNWADPSGLKIKYVDGTPGGTALAAFIAQIRSTKQGASLLKKLENRKETYTVNLNECGGTGGFNPKTNTIDVRNANTLIAAFDKSGVRGLHEVSAGRVLAHELGHALLRGGSENATIGIENGVFSPIDGYTRVWEGQ